MIINLWSTPRTGSVWYSIFLKSHYLNSVLLSEFFNRYHMNLYHRLLPNGKRVNLHAYETGLWYDEYTVVNKKISIEKIFAERSRSVEEEELYRIDLFNKLDHNDTFILHNHVAPINEEIRNRLTDIAGKNIYIYRKDKRAQLASYAIALSTKQFVQFTNNDETSVVEDIDPIHLKNLIDRIKVWDSLSKNDVICYEDITFIDKHNWPKKQNKNWRNRLSDRMISIIEDLVLEYEGSDKLL